MRMNNLIRYFAVAAVAALLLVRTAGAATEAAAKPFKVAIYEFSNPPYIISGENGELSGVEIDLVKSIAAKLKRPLELKRIPLYDAFVALGKGEVDAAIQIITVTEARKRSFNLSKPYAQGGSAFLYRKGEEEPTIITADAIRIGTVEGLKADLYLCHHGLSPFRYRGEREAIEDLKNGKIDTFFYDLSAITFYASEDPSLAVSERETRENYAIALRKGDDAATEAANAAIDEYLKKVTK